MPVEIDRGNPQKPIITIRMFNPLTVDEARKVRDELSDLVLAEESLAVLVDLGGVDSLSLLSIGMNNFDEFIPDTLGFHTEHSRVALLNGGPALKLALSFAGGYSNPDRIKDFSSEEKAITWLLEGAEQA